MIEFRQLNFLSFLADFGDRLGPAATYAASQALTTDQSLVVGAYRDGAPGGLAVLHIVNDTYVGLVNLAVLADHRGSGIGAALLGECIRRATESGRSVLRFWFQPESEFDYHLHNRLQSIGFAVQPQMMTTVIRVAQSRNDWEAFVSGPGARKIAALTELGYSVVSFADASAELLENLYQRSGRSYPAFLDPRLGEKTRLSDSSFIAVRDGQPAAFCVMSSIDNGRTAVLDSLAATSEDRGSGAFLMCVVSAVHSLLAHGCNKIAYAYSLTNGSLPDIVTSKEWFPGKRVTQLNEYSLALASGR